MDIKESLIVTEDDTRPSSEGHCFYCNAAVGKEHAANCVCREKTVVIKATFTLIVKKPQAWDSQDTNFHLNESSWCVDNLIKQMCKKLKIEDKRQEAEGISSCFCNAFDGEYVRDATKEDEERYGILPD